jgi:hypothetical protein
MESGELKSTGFFIFFGRWEAERYLFGVEWLNG